MYRLHTVKQEHMDLNDPFRWWDEIKVDDFMQAKKVFDQCNSSRPTLHDDVDPDEEYFDALPLTVFLTFADTTYRDCGDGYCIDKGIGVIDKKIIYPAERELKQEYYLGL